MGRLQWFFHRNSSLAGADETNISMFTFYGWGFAHGLVNSPAPLITFA